MFEKEPKFKEKETEKKPEEEKRVEEEIKEKKEIEKEFNQAELEKMQKEEEEKIERTQEELEETFKKIEKEKSEEKKSEGKEKNLETIKEVMGERVPETLKDLMGDDSEEAWKERESKDATDVCISLAGVASEKSREWLDEHKETLKLWWGISRGLMGDDSEEAWKIRDHLKFDSKVNRIRGGVWARIQKSIGLHKSERFFRLKEAFNTGLGKKLWGLYLPGDVVRSTTGLDSEKSWELRNELEDVTPAEVLMSLAGNDSKKAWEIRKKYEGDKKLRWAYEKSLIEVES
ncbi:MAG: hypothetical protein IB617_02510 [Candidatus Nealsonbacteria bacterium]|nr:MAG: hypothetical protein IB617_02510 [Candidatus Nealsonbacteria bacterium]